MSWIELLPPNLAKLGLKRATEADIPDLITIWKTPYPVLTRYKILCKDLRMQPFAGGTYEKQGLSVRPGYITSGYRDSIIEGRKNSPHQFALAIDVAIGDCEHQIQAAFFAAPLFPRIGFYPHNGFMHFDLASEAWMRKYSGRQYWVRNKAGIYSSFDILEDAVKYLK